MTEVLVESGVEDLNLLAGLPDEGSRPYWAGIFATSILIHIFLFSLAVQLPSFNVPSEPRHQIILRRTPLYLPRDVLTQKSPNRQKVSKSIDLADLLSTPSQQPQRAQRAASVKQFELPKQASPQKLAKAVPQILPDAPKLAVDQNPGPLPTGALNGLASPTPPPPSPKRTETPFQNIGSDVPANPHPSLKPPATGLESAIKDLAKDSTGHHLILSDDSPSPPTPVTPAPGTLGSPSAHHAAVELETDPQGADFRQYLAQILSIVRTNWRRVIPESARQGTLRGRSTVQFIVSRDGSIPKVVIANSSGSEALDRAATAGLSMSNPLPPLPADYKGYQVRLAFSFAYNMPTQ
jgi:TonB family protein